MITRGGLVSVALDKKGNKVSNPFKASLFGKDAGVTQLQKHFEQSKEKMKTNSARSVLKNTIELAIHTTNSETDFKKQLVEQGYQYDCSQERQRADLWNDFYRQ